MDYRPTGDWIWIRPDSQDKTPGGIMLPDSAKTQSKRGKVVGVGVGRYFQNGERLPSELKIGDTVFFIKHSGHELILENGEKVYAVRENEVLGTVK